MPRWLAILATGLGLIAATLLVMAWVMHRTSDAGQARTLENAMFHSAMVRGVRQAEDGRLTPDVYANAADQMVNEGHDTDGRIAALGYLQAQAWQTSVTTVWEDAGDALEPPRLPASGLSPLRRSYFDTAGNDGWDVGTLYLEDFGHTTPLNSDVEVAAAVDVLDLRIAELSHHPIDTLRQQLSRHLQQLAAAGHHDDATDFLTQELKERESAPDLGTLARWYTDHHETGLGARYTLAAGLPLSLGMRAQIVTAASPTITRLPKVLAHFTDVSATERVLYLLPSIRLSEAWCAMQTLDDTDPAMHVPILVRNAILVAYANEDWPRVTDWMPRLDTLSPGEQLMWGIALDRQHRLAEARPHYEAWLATVHGQESASRRAAEVLNRLAGGPFPTVCRLIQPTHGAHYEVIAGCGVPDVATPEVLVWGAPRSIRNVHWSSNVELQESLRERQGLELRTYRVHFKDLAAESARRTWTYWVSYEASGPMPLLPGLNHQREQVLNDLILIPCAGTVEDSAQSVIAMDHVGLILSPSLPVLAFNRFRALGAACGEPVGGVRWMLGTDHVTPDAVVDLAMGKAPELTCAQLHQVTLNPPQDQDEETIRSLTSAAPCSATWSYAAVCHWMQRQPDAALADLTHAPDSPLRSRYEYESGHYREAARDFERLAAHDPTCWLQAAHAWNHLHDEAAARQACEKCLQAAPRPECRALALAGLKRLPEAIQAAEGKDGDLLLGARLRRLAGQEPIAQADLQAALIQPGSTQDFAAIRRRAEIEDELGLNPDALHDYDAAERMAASDEDRAAAWLYHSLLLQRLHRPDDAAEALARAHELDPYVTDERHRF